jgi:hypothetical protein
LATEQESLNQLAFATNRHSGESLVPWALRDFGLGIKPLRQLFQLGRWNLPALDPLEQMLKEREWDVLAANSRQIGFQLSVISLLARF